MPVPAGSAARSRATNRPVEPGAISGRASVHARDERVVGEPDVGNDLGLALVLEEMGGNQYVAYERRHLARAVGVELEGRAQYGLNPAPPPLPGIFSDAPPSPDRSTEYVAFTVPCGTGATVKIGT